jgi:hypothetical protein
MPTPKKTPTTTVLEHFYTVSEAAIRLGLREPHEDNKRGEKWLRDGVNLKAFPHHRMARLLMFSDTDLAEIAAMSRTAPQRRIGRTPARAAA